MNVTNTDYKYIYACFSRTFDEHHKKVNRFHLISSVLARRESLDYNRLEENFTEKIRNDNSNYFIFDVYSNSNFIQTSWITNKSNYLNNDRVYYLNDEFVVLKLNQNLTIVVTSLENLAKEIKGGLFLKGDGKLNTLFGELSETEKKDNIISSRCLFVFNDLFWSNILLYFRICGIDISGGSISKRHVLSPVDFNLFKFMNIVIGDRMYGYSESDRKEMESFNNDMYFGMNNIVLSSKIPIKLYKNYEEIVKYTKNKIPQTSNNTDILIDSVSGEKADILKKVDENTLNFIISNYRSVYEYILSDIRSNLENPIKNKKDEIKVLNKKIDSLSYEINKTDDILYSTSHMMSVKSKKKLKKERRELSAAKQNNNNIIDNLKSERYSLQKRERILLDELRRLEIEIEKSKEELKFKNIEELISIYEDKRDKRQIILDKQISAEKFQKKVTQIKWQNIVLRTKRYFPPAPLPCEAGEGVGGVVFKKKVLIV